MSALFRNNGVSYDRMYKIDIKIYILNIINNNGF